MEMVKRDYRARHAGTAVDRFSGDLFREVVLRLVNTNNLRDEVSEDGVGREGGDGLIA
jgi:hypothetical protein